MSRPTWRGEELLAEVDHLGLSDLPESIAARLGVSAAAIEIAARRAGRADLAARFGPLASREAAGRRARRESDQGAAA